jgi:hypothetical protein
LAASPRKLGCCCRRENIIRIRAQSLVTEDGFNLGNWVNTQRGRKKRHSTERVYRLEGLTRWTWDAQEAVWGEGFSVLEKFVAREGPARVPAGHTEDGLNLGKWVSLQRGGEESLSPDRISRHGGGRATSPIGCSIYDGRRPWGISTPLNSNQASSASFSRGTEL